MNKNLRQEVINYLMENGNSNVIINISQFAAKREVDTSSVRQLLKRMVADGTLNRTELDGHKVGYTIINDSKKIYLDSGFTKNVSSVGAKLEQPKPKKPSQADLDGKYAIMYQRFEEKGVDVVKEETLQRFESLKELNYSYIQNKRLLELRKQIDWVSQKLGERDEREQQEFLHNYAIIHNKVLWNEVGRVSEVFRTALYGAEPFKAATGETPEQRAKREERNSLKAAQIAKAFDDGMDEIKKAYDTFKEWLSDDERSAFKNYYEDYRYNKPEEWFNDIEKGRKMTIVERSSFKKDRFYIQFVKYFNKYGAAIPDEDLKDDWRGQFKAAYPEKMDNYDGVYWLSSFVDSIRAQIDKYRTGFNQEFTPQQWFEALMNLVNRYGLTRFNYVKNAIANIKVMLGLQLDSEDRLLMAEKSEHDEKVFAEWAQQNINVQKIADEMSREDELQSAVSVSVSTANTDELF